MKVKHINGDIGASAPEPAPELLEAFGMTEEQWGEAHKVEELDVPDIGSSDPMVLQAYVRKPHLLTIDGYADGVVKERLAELVDKKRSLEALDALLGGKALSVEDDIKEVQSDIDNLLSSIPEE